LLFGGFMRISLEFTKLSYLFPTAEDSMKASVGEREREREKEKEVGQKREREKTHVHAHIVSRVSHVASN